jgi:hypothetical protein
MKLTLKIASLCLVLFLPIRNMEAATGRQVGPEPGLAAGVPPSGVSLCAYGEYLRPLGSSFGGNCSNFIKLVDDYITHANINSSWTLIPFSVAQHYFVRVRYNGLTYNALTSYSTSTKSDYGLDISDPNFHSYLFGEYIPRVFLPHGPNAKNHIPSDSSHPTYLAEDGYNTDYKFLGVRVNGSFTSNVKWDSAYPQNSTEWLNGWEAFHAYAKEHAPSIRLNAHIGSMSDPGWNTFHQLYANCPAIMRETFKISSLSTLSSYAHSQFYNQLLNLYWFANVAAPVFSTAVNPNEPRTRVLQFGTWLDNGDIHTALATYLMVRGPNTFFDLLRLNPQVGVNPSLWLPVTNAIGAGTSAPTVIRSRSGSGYVLLQRNWQYGISYLNLSGSTQVISLPSGSKNWSGKSISTLTLGNGKGDVVLR